MDLDFLKVRFNNSSLACWFRRNVQRSRSLQDCRLASLKGNEMNKQTIKKRSTCGKYKIDHELSYSEFLVISKIH